MSYGKGKAVFLLLSVGHLAARVAVRKTVTTETPKVRVLPYGLCSHGVTGRRMRFKPAFRKEYEFKSRWEYLHMSVESFRYSCYNVCVKHEFGGSKYASI